MHKILILLLIVLPLRLLATKIEIVADVNGEPISNLDIEKRINFINSLFGKEADDVKRKTEKPDYLITFQEFIIPDQKDDDVYGIAEDLVKELRNSNAPESPIKMCKATVNLSQLKDKLKSVLETLESDIADPFSFSEGYSIIKVIDKVQLNYALLESTL